MFDDKYANTTTVFVQVLDVNDNPPKFDNAIYNVTDAQEEESGISKNNPKYLLTVNMKPGCNSGKFFVCTVIWVFPSVADVLRQIEMEWRIFRNSVLIVKWDDFSAWCMCGRD